MPRLYVWGIISALAATVAIVVLLTTSGTHTDIYNAAPYMPALLLNLESFRSVLNALILGSHEDVRMASFSPMDPSSFSRPDEAIVTNIRLSLKVDFERKVFGGGVDLTVKRVDPNAKRLILDVKDLKISSVQENESKQSLKYETTPPVKEFGSQLNVILPEKGDDVVISIKYETSPSASGLQWLDPQQTAGKKHPYVFSQFQPIHARSVVPCQDTPGVKAKYQAIIEVPKNLTAVMSAIPDGTEETPDTTKFRFKQDIPIPSYLMAIAVGALKSKRIGPRSTVWSEEELIEASAYEFANTEKQLKTAEDICGPYLWGIYDLLVLPPSFPFGGMENPCLTFVTPTLLAGDRSLANVVAHEIAHSWTGNLVTNANFEHFWLNEGFTVFVERKIVGRLESKEEQDFEAYGGTGELKETIDEMGATNPLTSLVVNLTGVHPDDAFSKVPYEKGQTFLRYLESLVGGPDEFEPFLRKYFDTFKFKSIVTSDFKDFFTSYFAKSPKIASVDWNEWLHKPGMPPVIPAYDDTLLKSIQALKATWLAWNESDETVPFDATVISTEQRIQLLSLILETEPQPIRKLELVDAKFDFINCKNAEIKFRWFRIGIKARWGKVVQPTLEWVNQVGRMKYLRPLYRDLYGWAEERSRAIDNFQKNRKFMMHVSAYTVAKDLHLSE